VSRFFIARHGETVFNAAGRMQDDHGHTPLTRSGFRQAEAMGDALKARLGAGPDLALWSSPSGRALQTLAVAVEPLGLDWHGARTDPRLVELGMGEWTGRYYRDIIAEVGPIYDPETALFTRRAPRGESYEALAGRLRAWLDETADPSGDRLVLTHGMSSRVLRGLLTGAPAHPGCGAPVARALPQGAIVEVADAVETVIEPPA
jgi:glucosyl-3-phosphoglycerate phosphatase